LRFEFINFHRASAYSVKIIYVTYAYIRGFVFNTMFDGKKHTFRKHKYNYKVMFCPNYAVMAW